MDSKIILAILIVALIGVVAATYHNESNDIINSLSSVATEEPPTESVSIEEGDVGIDSTNNLQIDEDTVKPDKSIVTQTDKKSSSSSNKNQKTTQNTAKNSKINTNTTTANTNTIKTNRTNSITQNIFNISRAQAINKALTDLPDEYKDSTYKITDPTVNSPYYIITFYQNGKTIGYYEIDANTNRITGGAFENETP